MTGWRFAALLCCAIAFGAETQRSRVNPVPIHIISEPCDPCFGIPAEISMENVFVIDFSEKIYRHGSIENTYLLFFTKCFSAPINGINISRIKNRFGFILRPLNISWVNVEGSPEGKFSYCGPYPRSDAMSGSLSEILNSEYDFALPSQSRVRSIKRHADICTQLSFRGFLCANYKSARMPPKQEGGEKKKAGENDQGGIGDFESAPGYHPELGAIISSLMSLLLGFVSFGFGMPLWDNRKLRLWGGFCLGFGVISGLHAILGWPFGLDWWTFWRALS
jgi:hypothetical protein